jgi:hypothetical protein
MHLFPYRGLWLSCPYCSLFAASYDDPRIECQERMWTVSSHTVGEAVAVSEQNSHHHWNGCMCCLWLIAWLPNHHGAGELQPNNLLNMSIVRLCSRTDHIAGRTLILAVTYLRWLVAGFKLPLLGLEIVWSTCGICGGQSGCVAGFLGVLQFPLPLIPSTTCFTALPSTTQGPYNRTINDLSNSRLGFTPAQR